MNNHPLIYSSVHYGFHIIDLLQSGSITLRVWICFVLIFFLLLHLQCFSNVSALFLLSWNPRNSIIWVSTTSVLILELINVMGMKTQRLFVRNDVSRMEILDPLADLECLFVQTQDNKNKFSVSGILFLSILTLSGQIQFPQKIKLNFYINSLLTFLSRKKKCYLISIGFPENISLSWCYNPFELI